MPTREHMMIEELRAQMAALEDRIAALEPKKKAAKKAKDEDAETGK